MGILRETIRPSSDLRNKYPEISKSLQLKDEAAIITVNGRGDTVSPVSYTHLDVYKRQPLYYNFIL